MQRKNLFITILHQLKIFILRKTTEANPTDGKNISAAIFFAKREQVSLFTSNIMTITTGSRAHPIIRLPGNELLLLRLWPQRAENIFFTFYLTPRFCALGHTRRPLFVTRNVGFKWISRCFLLFFSTCCVHVQSQGFERGEAKFLIFTAKVSHCLRNNSNCECFS